jgi:hypothetical protein
MKTVRFTHVIEASGRPEVYLLLLDPKKDAEFQRALKAHRIMTLHQTGPTDFGTVGYEPGAKGQQLLFPRSLKKFAAQRVVGIDYGQLKEESAPARKPVGTTSPKTKAVALTRPKKKSSTAAPKPVAEPAPAKVIPFQSASPAEDEEESDEVAEIKAVIRRALKALEAGKQVAAFNLLKRIVE